MDRGNVYIERGSLKIRRVNYSWDLINIKNMRARLEYRVKGGTDGDITYEEYQQAMMLLMKGGYVKV